MKSHPIMILIVLLTIGCTQQDTFDTVTINEDLTVEKIQEDVFRAIHSFPWPANSLLVRTDRREFVLVDTPWNDSGTRALIEWVREHFGNVRITAVNTHFHRDNLGGNGYLLSQGIPAYGSDLTVKLLAEKKDELRERTLANLSRAEYKRFLEAYKTSNAVPPDHVFPSEEGLILTVGNETVELFYPGPAHTQDNIVVYFPNRKLLFGGCMVRSLASQRIGRQSDADFEAWPRSIRNLMDTYPDARLVIPGHGKPGGLSLLNHTLKLVEERAQE